MRKFDSINIGDKAEICHVITQADIDRFVELTGDNNKLHVDKEFAKETFFKKPVAHGMLGASFISTLIGTKLPGDGALWFAQNLEFLLPVRVGDTIMVKAEVVKKNKRAKTVELTTNIFNQNKQKVTAGTAQVKMVEQNPQTVKEKSKKPLQRVALIIGGTGGIGKEVCIQLASDGYDVAVHYCRNEEKAKMIQKEIVAMGKKAMIVNADITDFDQVQTMIQSILRTFETITVIVNCSAKDISNIKFQDLDWRTVQEHFDVNVKGIFHIQKCVLPIMEKNGYGKIINITTQAIEKPSAEWLHYITAKSALHGFTKALAVELAPKGIRVNAISPGMTDTELIANIPEKVRLLTEVQTPLGRIAQPKDIAGAVSFLASEKADFLTGETIRVNGGQVML